MGIEPTFSAWKAEVIASIRHPRLLTKSIYIIEFHLKSITFTKEINKFIKIYFLLLLVIMLSLVCLFSKNNKPLLKK